MAWYQRAKDKARIRELEARYAELVGAIRDILARFREGAVDEALRLLEAQYQYHVTQLDHLRSEEDEGAE